MDQFTQRMLERARARQEKIDQKLASSGQAVPKRKPLSENISVTKTGSPIRSPSKVKDVTSPRKPSKTETPSKIATRRPSIQKEQKIVTSPHKSRNDVVVTKKEFGSPRGSLGRRNSDVSLEINITHRNDIKVDVQIEEYETPITVTYNIQEPESNVIIKEIEDNTRMASNKIEDVTENKNDRAGLRNNFKSRLDRLGNLYSDKPLSSPIHRTEQDFTAATPPKQQARDKPEPKDGKRKFGRLAALADQINNWEDDLSHHTYNAEPTKKNTKPETNQEALDSSTLDVSIHSIKDINQVLQKSATKSKQTSKATTTRPSTKPAMNECQRLKSEIVAELEPKCASTTPSAATAPAMATMVAGAPPTATVTKKPSLKKYRAPTPPTKVHDDDTDKDKENNVIQPQENGNDANDCIQTKQEPAEPKPAEKGSPVVRKLVPKLNGNVDRSSVLSKAALFEAGSPRNKDPAEMSLRERKALFEKNKGAAIIPKAPFGMAPSVKTLQGDKVDKRAASAKTTPTKTNSTNSSRTNSKDNLADDNVSQSSLGGGIKGKLAALFSKEQTISESTIANKFKQEREKEMEMLQNRFHYKAKDQPPNNESDDDHSDTDPSEKAPLMGSTTNIAAANKKPEIIANVPKVTFDDKSRIENDIKEREAETKEKVVGSQPVKRRSSQDSPVVLSVLEDVKRIKVNNNKKEPLSNMAITQQPSLYPHLSDIETDNSHTQEEYSDCGGSSTDDNLQRSRENLNQSDNWAETSFGREVMNVVKKNNTSYKKAVRESDSESDLQSACDSELDDMLDEALAHEDGPTPPKVNKHGSVTSSNSFVYQQSAFKSPQKPATATPRTDRGNELVHSVSFYRRMQSASSTPTTPLRIIRHTSPEREIPPTPEGPSTNVTTVRQRIKELQEEIAKQQTVISQASQALNLCAATIEFSGSTEQAEGERLLLLATHRRQACIHEVQRLQVEGAGPASAPGAASLHARSLAIPLRRDYVRHLNADGAVGHHAVCLLKCRDRVLATSMQQTQPTSTTLTFPDEIRMDGLASDFKVTVEVYLLQASKEILPHEVKYHINNKKNSKLLTPRGKVSELKVAKAGSPGGPGAARSPQFQLHGYCIFALAQAKRNTFTLNKVPCGSPLEGTVSVQISAKVLLPAPPPHAAFLTAFDDVSGLGAWHRRWFELRPPILAYWKYPDDVNRKAPIGEIDLTTVISDKVTCAPREMCARPNTLVLECAVNEGVSCGSLVVVSREGGGVARRHLLAADTRAHRDSWLAALNDALDYVRCCAAGDQ